MHLVFAEDRLSPVDSPKKSKTTLIKNLAIEPGYDSNNTKPSRTPKIPGVNVPKRGSKK